MADLRIVDAPVLLQESITDDVKMPTGGLGNYAIRLGDLVWYVVAKEQLANKNYVDLSSKSVKDSLDVHIADKANPHQVTKEQVGLGNVDNTADIDKPVSNAVNSAIITATTDMATKAYVNQKDNLKADKATTLSGYGITDAYTKDETYNRDEINSTLSLKANTSYVDGKSGDLTTLTTTDKSSLVKAVNEVYDKTAIFYNTVADMVADKKLKAGKAVITHGYYSANDGGGARYLIKDTATDYSIPIANNLHAVFADSFDIRKFGIVDSKTKNQDVELARMRNYADTREYEIDFHNFWIRAPKENYPYMGKGKYLGTVKGLWFEQAHKYKNLKITHDKTVRLNTGEHLLVFAPVTNPDVETWVVFENITLDAWCDNYQPLTEDYHGYYDGQRHGIFCHPRHEEMGGEIRNWATQTNYSFRFKDIHFESPAYSYNITTNAVCARQNIIENVTGTYVGLFYNFQALDVIAKDITVYRDRTKLEAGRLMVGTILHHEPELGGMSRDFNKYYFENVRGTVSGNSASLLFKLSPIGNGQTFKEIEIVDCDGEVVIDGGNATTHKFTRSGGEGTNSFYNTNVGVANITDFTIKAFPFSPEFGMPTTLLIGNTTITTLNIDRCVVIDPLTWGSDPVGNITNLNITDSTINNTGIGSQYGGIWLINSYGVKVNNITLTRVTTDVRALLKCECQTININDILILGTITSDYMDFKVGTFCNLYCYDVKFAATQTEGTYFTKGDHYLRIHGGVEEKSKITASSTSPYHGVIKKVL